MNAEGQHQVSSDGTVGKAFHVLDMVAGRGKPVRFNDLLARSPYPKATLYRLLQTLTNQGALTFDEERQTYGPGLRLVRLAHEAWRQSSLAPIARPHLDRLSRDTGETIHLAQLDRGHVLYVDKRNAETPVEMFSQAGKTGPGYCTGVGKAMIAFLPDDAREDAIQRQAFYRHTERTLTNPDALRADLATIRAEGVAYDREEHEAGIICVATPILARSGRVLGALSITASASVGAMDDLSVTKPRLLETADAIARAAENWQFPSAIGRNDSACPE